MKAVVAAFNQEKALVGAFPCDYEPSDGTFSSTTVDQWPVLAVTWPSQGEYQSNLFYIHQDVMSPTNSHTRPVAESWITIQEWRESWDWEEFHKELFLLLFTKDLLIFI